MGGKYRATGSRRCNGGWRQPLGFAGTFGLAFAVWTVQVLSPFAYWMSCGEAEQCSYANDDLVGLVYFAAPLLLGIAAVVVGLVFRERGRPYFYLPLAALTVTEVVYVLTGVALPDA